MAGVDVLIATALEMERDAVRHAAAWCDESQSGVRRWEEKDTDKYPDYLLGEYVLVGGSSITVALARPTRMGGIFMSNIVSTLMERLDPRCLAMCGVCAGNPSDLALGDVAIANTVFQYDEGKRTSMGLQGDLFPTPMDIKWVQRAQSLRPDGLPSYGDPSQSDTIIWLLERLSAAADPSKHPAFERYVPAEKWPNLITQMERDRFVRREGRKFVIAENGMEFLDRSLAYKVGAPLKLPFAIKVGPMASGNAVVKDGITWDMLKTVGQRSAIALEMEAASIGVAGYTRSLSQWIVVKGIMDHADPNKDDRYKPFAARASAEVLLRFLEQVAGSMRYKTRPLNAAIASGLPTDVDVPKISLPDDSDHGRLTVLVVCREAGSDALATVTERALVLGRTNHNLEKLAGKSIADNAQQIHENVFRLDVGAAFLSRPTMTDCLRAVSRADIVIFDVTKGPDGIEPGVMLLLGVRAVARRGVSICSVDRNPDQLLDIGLPYNLQHLNIASHGENFGELDAAERLAVKMANGLHDIIHDPSYLDLPAFDSIRNLGGDLRDYAPIPFYRGPLYLGPFDEDFQRSCFRKLEPEIVMLLDGIARDKDGRDYKRPRTFLLLDYDRARMVSQSLYHSIRRHDFCLIDWTWLRPNVFFEFGVRLASRQSGDVHIVANLMASDSINNDLDGTWPRLSRNPDDNSDATRLAQVKGLRDIFAPIEYKPTSVANLRAASAAILVRWRSTRESRHENAVFFTEIARAASPPAKGAVESITEFLSKRSMIAYLHDQDSLLSTLLYEDYNSALQRAAVAQSIALRLAALFIVLSTNSAAGKGLLPTDEIEDTAQEIRRLARRVGTERDVQMLSACLDTIRKLFATQ